MLQLGRQKDALLQSEGAATIHHLDILRKQEEAQNHARRSMSIQVVCDYVTFFVCLLCVSKAHFRQFAGD